MDRATESSEIMTVEEVAAYLHVTVVTVYRWVRQGALPAVRLGRLLRFSRSRLERWMEGKDTAKARGVEEAQR